MSSLQSYSQALAPYGAPHGLPPFVPLAWRTHLAAIAIGGCCVTDFVFDGLQIGFARDLVEDSPALGPALLVAVVPRLMVTLVAGAVFFGIFVVRAANNVRSLGRTGVQYSPGWCIGSFFVPFANLWKEVVGAKPFREARRSVRNVPTANFAVQAPLWRHECHIRTAVGEPREHVRKCRPIE